jgi:L-fuculose-phosphate aldolase
LKGKWGMQDPRTEIKNCDICANDVFRDSWKETGVARTAFSPPGFKQNSSGDSSAAPSAGKGTADQEALIQAITDRVLAELSKRK